MKNFKSAVPVGDLGMYATMIVIIGITIGIGSLILMTMDDTETVSPVTYYNQTVAATNNTYLALTYPRAITIVSVGNASAATTGGSYGSGNISTLYANRTASSFRWVGWPDFTAGQNVWVYYTYSDNSDTSDALMAANDAIGTFSDWLTIIAIVVVAVVVLSLIKYL